MREKGKIGYLFKKTQLIVDSKPQTTWADVGIPYRYEEQEKRFNTTDMVMGVRKTAISAIQVSRTQLNFEDDDKVSDTPFLNDASRIYEVVSKTIVGRGRMHRNKELKEYTFRVS